MFQVQKAAAAGLDLKDFEEIESKLGYALPERLKEFYLQYIPLHDRVIGAGDALPAVVAVHRQREVTVFNCSAKLGLAPVYIKPFTFDFKSAYTELYFLYLSFFPIGEDVYKRQVSGCACFPSSSFKAASVIL